MRSLFVILFFLSCSILPAQNDTLNRIDSAGKKQGYFIITGKMKNDKSFADSAIVEEGNYVNSSRTGVWTSYYPSGGKKSEMTYVNNRPNGHAVFYNENGHKSEEGTWIHNRWIGDYKMFYDNDSLRLHYLYDSIGRPLHRSYYFSNGKMEFDVQVKDGFSNGWTKEYNDSGRLYRQTFFVNGSIDSSRTKIFPPLPEENDSQKDNRDYQYDPNRKKYYENSNHHGFDEGQRVLYKNGKISQKGIFRDNKLLTGEERVYDANGNLVQVKLFRDGKYVGDGPIPADANK